MVIWFSGVSGSGKTTLGKKFFNFLKKKSSSTIFFDGDKFRSLFKNDLGYTMKDRDTNAYRLTRLVNEISRQKINVIVSANLTSLNYRKWCRKKIKNYYEIYLEAKKSSLLKRDYKNLYKNATKGKLKNVVGIDLPFIRPKGCDMYIKNDSSKKNLYLNISKIYIKINSSNIKIY
jgi:adenylylsulfate kinase-like enzyme